MSKTNRNRHLDVHGSDIVTHIHQITGNNLLDKSAFRLITPKNLKHNDDFIEVTKIKLPREKHKERPKFNISLDQEAAARTVIKNALKVPYYNNNEVFAYVVHIKVQLHHLYHARKQKYLQIYLSLINVYFIIEQK